MSDVDCMACLVSQARGIEDTLGPLARPIRDRTGVTHATVMTAGGARHAACDFEIFGVFAGRSMWHVRMRP